MKHLPSIILCHLAWWLFLALYRPAWPRPFWDLRLWGVVLPYAGLYAHRPAGRAWRLWVDETRVR